VKPSGNGCSVPIVSCVPGRFDVSSASVPERLAAPLLAIAAAVTLYLGLVVLPPDLRRDLDQWRWIEVLAVALGLLGLYGLVGPRSVAVRLAAGAVRRLGLGLRSPIYRSQQDRSAPRLTAAPAKPTFEAFLSHRYQCPDDNLYFFHLLQDVANVQFQVDEDSSRSLSTTRLERLIRHADAFIGIYSIDYDRQRTPDRNELLRQSRYFRLELDMAIRSGRPTFLFFDERYGGLFGSLPGVTYCPYDAQEILSTAPPPARDRQERQLSEFCGRVAADQELRRIGPGVPANRVVGVFQPPLMAPDDLRSAEAIDDVLRGEGCSIRRFPWPPVLDLPTQTVLAGCDWILVETSAPECAAVVAHLHGRFIPMMRMRHAGPSVGSEGDGEPIPAADAVLFGGLEVGYVRDVLSWSGSDALRGSLRDRVRRTLEPATRMNDTQSAVAYFQKAAKRKERVFLSYAGVDTATAAPLVHAFEERFQFVFDFRNRSLIGHGRPWREVIFDTLSKATVGVPLMSHAAVTRERWRDEVEVMLTARDEGRMKVFPIKLDEVPTPVHLQPLQYLRVADYSPSEMVEQLIDQLDEMGGGPPRTRW